MSKAGRVAEAFRLIKSLPEPIDIERRKKASRFEKGLSSFLDRVLRKSFNQFKEEYDEGQVRKKRAAVQLINATMNKNRRLYNRWNNI